MKIRPNRIFVSIVLTFALFMSGLTVMAQSGGSGQSTDSTGVVIPEAIPTQDLIQKIEEAAEEIKITERKIRLKDDVISLDTLFPAYVKFIREQKKSTESFIKSNPNRQKINNQIEKWNGYDTHLTSWEAEVNEYEGRNVKLLEGVRINEQIWKLSYENTLDEKLPREVARRVKETHQSFINLRKRIVKENNEYLILESRINKQKVGIADVVERLENLKESEIYDLFYLRHPALWSADFSELFSETGGANTGTEFDQNIRDIGKYFQMNRGIIFKFLVIVLLIFLLLRWLKGVFNKYEFKSDYKNLRKARDVIVKHGREALVFLAALVSVFYFENPPTLMNDLLVLLVLVFSIPLIRPFMKPQFRNLLYYVVVIYLLDSSKTYMWFNSLQYRIYLLIEASLVIYLIYWFAFRHMKTVKYEEHKFGTLLMRVAPVLQLIALISIVSNVLGYTNLTDLTLKIASQSGVYAVIFYALLMVMGGVSTGLIHYFFSSRGIQDLGKKTALEMRALKMIRGLTFFFWLLIFLSIVDLLNPLMQILTDVITEPYIFGSISITIGDILRFLSILTISFLITSLVAFLFDSGQFSIKYLKLPKGIPAAISLVIRYFIIATGIILALSSLGVDLSKFNLMAGALGLGIGFGLQNVISNFVSGLILVFERPILVGDTVEVNNLMGTVNRIGVRSSNISTFDGAEVVVPNSNLISNDLINWTLSSNLKRIEILIGVAYGTNPNEVLEILKGVVDQAEDALKEPNPQILFSDFGDSSLNFRVRFWVPFEHGLQAKSDVSIAIYNAFEERGIEIPFPQRDIHIKTVPPESGEEKLNPPK